jgi:hypothetical protein
MNNQKKEITPAIVKQRNSYNAYHSNMIFAFQMKLLPQKMLSLIPYSTRNNWKNYNTNKQIGAKDSSISSSDIDTLKKLLSRKKLLAAVAILMRINDVLLKTFANVRGHKKLLANSKNKIINIAERFDKSLEKQRILRWFGVTMQQFHYWKRNLKKCPSSIIDLCRTKHPQQLTTTETKTIQKYIENQDFAPWSLASIYYKILGNKAAFFALSTFYLYARKFGLSKNFKSFKKRKEGIRASKPGEIIHADITEYRLTDHRKVYIYHFADNFSRFPFRCMASFDRLPKITLKNLTSILEDYPHLFKERFTLLVDDGIENKGELTEFALRNKEFILLLIAMKDIMVSNSMIEARNKSLKNEYLQDEQFGTLKALQEFIDVEYLGDYRNRTLQALHGLTPIDVLNGAIPDKNRYKADIAAARIARVAVNQAFNCNDCSDETVVN